MNFFSSVREARQKILHGNILINGKVIKESSYNMKESDCLSFCNEKVIFFKNIFLKNIQSRKNFNLKIPNYLEYDLDNMLFIFTKINLLSI